MELPSSRLRTRILTSLECGGRNVYLVYIYPALDIRRRIIVRLEYLPMCETKKFSSVLTGVRNCILPWVTWIQSTPLLHFFGIQWRVILSSEFFQVAKLLICIREMRGSNLNWDISCSDWGFSWFCSVLRDECQNNIFKMIQPLTSPSFPIIYLT